MMEGLDFDPGQLTPEQRRALIANAMKLGALENRDDIISEEVKRATGQVQMPGPAYGIAGGLGQGLGSMFSQISSGISERDAMSRLLENQAQQMPLREGIADVLASAGQRPASPITDPLFYLRR